MVTELTGCWPHSKPAARTARQCLPVVAEAHDGVLNDINAHDVTVDHVAEALDHDLLRRAMQDG